MNVRCHSSCTKRLFPRWFWPLARPPQHTACFRSSWLLQENQHTLPTLQAPHQRWWASAARTAQEGGRGQALCGWGPDWDRSVKSLNQNSSCQVSDFATAGFYQKPQAVAGDVFWASERFTERPGLCSSRELEECAYSSFRKGHQKTIEALVSTFFPSDRRDDGNSWCATSASRKKREKWSEGVKNQQHIEDGS